MRPATRRTIRRAALASGLLVVLLAAFALQPSRDEEALSSLPADAVATGIHRDIRATWRDQVRHPVVARLLAAYGLDPEDVIGDPGVAWTFRLAIGRVVGSALIRRGDEYMLAAASPTGARAPLLRLFLAIRWIPGLGRLAVAESGVRYADISPRNARTPLILSLSIQNGVLRAKLGHAPESFDDMSAAPPSAASAALTSAAAAAPTSHTFTFTKGLLQSLGLEDAAGDAIATVTPDGDNIAVVLRLKLDDATNEELLEFSRLRVRGENAAVSALGAGHAAALALLPSRYISPLAISVLRAGKGAPSDDDAALYLTTAPYGGQLYAFSIPAATFDVPGVVFEEKPLRQALGRFMPKMLREMFVVNDGATTACSSASSLRAQRHAAPSEGVTWHDAFRALDAKSPCAFVFLDIDPLAQDARQVLQAVQMLKTFGVVSLEPEMAAGLSTAIGVLPRVPTRVCAASAFAAEGDSAYRLDLRLIAK